MSAQATLARGGFERLRALGPIAASEPIPTATVALGGAAFGFFCWYAALARLEAVPFAATLALPLALLAGAAALVAAWRAWAGVLVRRGGVAPAAALRWNAPAWPLLGLAGVGVVVPLGAGSPSRTAGLAIALFALWQLVVAARFSRSVRAVLAAFVVTRIPIIVIAELAPLVVAARPGLHAVASTNPLLAVWGRWDAVHYLDIAQRGYYGTDMAFFPLYPALVGVVGRVAGSDIVAGLLISNVALFAGLLFFYRLVARSWSKAVANRAVFYVSIFPTAVFFSAVYTESLFFALTVGAFYFIRRRRWLTAGAVGALAALTRVEGVLLAVPFAIEAYRWYRRGGVPIRSAAFARAAAGLALVPAGLGLYMTWLWVLGGDPLYFSHVQSHWNRRLAPPWVSLTHAAHVLRKANVALTRSNEAIELAFTALMIGVFAFGVRRLPLSFTAYMALSILVPMSTSSLMSMPRFALVLFPMFVVLALWGERPWVNSAVVAFSLPLLGLFTVLFADWYWVA